MLQKIGRECVIDVETTGSDPHEDRIVEIGVVEMENGYETGSTFQCYVDPMHPIHEEAVKVHGLTAEHLSNYGPFPTVVDDLLLFVRDAPLIAHNGNAFDFVILQLELQRCGRQPLANQMIDTIVHARRRFPGSRVGLDALCDRFGVDRRTRTNHGAVLDSQLLARVYNRLIGRDDLLYALQEEGGPQRHDTVVHDDLVRCAAQEWFAKAQPALASSPLFATQDELRRHGEFVAKIGNSVWAKIDSPQEPAADDGTSA